MGPDFTTMTKALALLATLKPGEHAYSSFGDILIWHTRPKARLISTASAVWGVVTEGVAINIVEGGAGDHGESYYNLVATDHAFIVDKTPTSETGNTATTIRLDMLPSLGVAVEAAALALGIGGVAVEAAALALGIEGSEDDA